jgi:metal-responsive CopG/Arc/MetJ family transcriptional regulator
MRTTIEIPDELRAKLLELAARRGLSGYSTIVQEALEHYLSSALGDVRRRRALDALGSLSAKDASELRESVLALRQRWR